MEHEISCDSCSLILTTASPKLFSWTCRSCEASYKMGEWQQRCKRKVRPEVLVTVYYPPRKGNNPHFYNAHGKYYRRLEVIDLWKPGKIYYPEHEVR